MHVRERHLTAGGAVAVFVRVLGYCEVTRSDTKQLRPVYRSPKWWNRQQLRLTGCGSGGGPLCPEGQCPA